MLGATAAGAAAAVLLVMTGLAASTMAAATCDRDALLSSVDDFLTGLTMGWAGALQNVDFNFVYVENGKVQSITDGIMFHGMSILYSRNATDLDACASFTELMGWEYTNARQPYLMALQMTHNASEAMALTLIDIVVSTTGARNFDANATLRYVAEETRDAIEPPSSRDSRAALKSVADSYLEQLAGGGGSGNSTGLFATPCDYLDESLRSPCQQQQQQQQQTWGRQSDRRYLIDESLGAVSVLCVAGGLHNATASHEFRIEHTKIRYVHSITGVKAASLS